MNKIKTWIIEKYLPEYSRKAFIVEIEKHKRNTEHMRTKYDETCKERDEYAHACECMKAELRGMQRFVKRIHIKGIYNAEES